MPENRASSFSSDSPEADVFWEPAESARAEIKIKRSLFIGRLFLCKTAELARQALAETEAEHRGANHNCWAYRLGPDTDVAHSSDDGEPAGTAGKPILSAIRQSGLVNLMVIVTRYFGGIKLGVRGLTEAYGQAASDVIAQAPRARRVRRRRFRVRFPYDAMGDVARLLDVYEGMSPAWSHGADAELFADVRLSAAPKVAAALDELRARKRIRSWSWES